ncbi:MAG: SWIM zinc finger family protein [Desulfomonilaceae bacterium]
MSRWYYRDYYTPAVPREVKGGIKAQTKRGGFGQSWWAKRWIQVLESFNIGARLGRGRSYARRGQVVSIVIAKGSVSAAVQGTRAKPYDVAITVKSLSAPEWGKILKALSEQMIFAAKLLAGEMPDNIEDVFKEQKISLFPQKLKDLETNCSCPDWSNPCKHIAAVYYLLGEEFDRDPFLIFKLRGMDREELVRGLGQVHDELTKKKKPGSRIEEPEPECTPAPEPLPEDPDLFWRSLAREGAEEKEVSIPRVHAALVKRLGSFPLWRGREHFVETLERVYSVASSPGLDIYLGSRD